MNIVQGKNKFFQVVLGGPNSVIITKGLVLDINPRKAPSKDADRVRVSPPVLYPAGGDLSYYTDSGSGPGDFNTGLIRRLEVAETLITNVRVTEDSRLYLRIRLSVDLLGGINGPNYVEFGTGSGQTDKDVFDVGIGSPGAQLTPVGKYYFINDETSFDYVIQKEDPEVQTHNKSRSIDRLYDYNGGIGNPDWRYEVITHILIAEVRNSEGKVKIIQRHRGPIMFFCPTILAGDFRYRGNL